MDFCRRLTTVAIAALLKDHYLPECCCWSKTIQRAAGSLRQSKPATPWRSQSSEDWLRQEAERKSELVPEIRSQREESPAGTRWKNERQSKLVVVYETQYLIENGTKTDI